jgi:molybdate/tungstate transport system substrate-binding protein
MSMTAQRSRRSVIAAVGGVGLGSIAGCLGGRESVQVLAAGSLAQTFERFVNAPFTELTGVAVYGEYFGSMAVMRMVSDRTKHPDVVVSADATLLRDRLYDEHASWDVEFASNVLGIGYDADTPFGAGLSAGRPWYELLLDRPEGTVAIGDPALDPLGYRALQAFELAAREHDLDGFRAAAEGLVSEEPDEPQLLAQVGTGARAGAICYRNMAVDHGLPFQAFPPAYNFAEPRRADHYATAAVTVGDEGTTVVGRPILYNATVLETADRANAGRQFVRFLTDRPDLLEDAGLAVTDALPQWAGAVPAELAR